VILMMERLVEGSWWKDIRLASATAISNHASSHTLSQEWTPRGAMTRAALLTSSAFLVIAWIVPCAPWHALTTTRGHRSAVSMMARPKGASKAVRREKLLDNMDSGTSRREPDGKWEEDPSTPLALLAVRAGDARKARDVSALRVGHLTSATNYFVNMVGSSKAQINAIVKSVEDDAEEAGFRVGKRQGTAVSGWVCLDFDDVVVNVFSEEQASPDPDPDPDHRR